MTDTQTRAISVINRLLHPGERHKVELDAELTELFPCALSRHYCLPIALEEEFSIEIGEQAIHAWLTVGDVIASVQKEVAHVGVE